jgi:STE24 endopeptidase
VAEGALLAWLGLRPPRRVRRLVERGRARPLLAAAAVGGGLSLVLVVVSLPFAIPAEQRARDFGLSTQNWGGWTGDLVKSSVIGALLTALGAAILMALVRRFPRSWFAFAALAIVVLGTAFQLLAPVLIDPLFNKFTPLPKGPLHSEVLGLAHQAGVKVGQVYRIDASRRTTGANAYVGGIGATKRVVLYDTLLRDFSDDQIRSTVAHELGHVKHRDVPRGLLWLAIVAPAATLVVQRLTERWAPPGERGPALILPAALALALVSFVMGSASNVLSREVEASADGYALKLTHDPAALIQVQRKLAIQNVADPDPPGWSQLLFGTHPTAVERIGSALTWAHEQ